jgi:Fe2+ transport system protein FeoA
MRSIHLAFSSDRDAGSETTRPTDVERVLSDPPARRLSSLAEGEHAIVVDIRADRFGRAGRLLALGVTPGARVTMLQRFPGIVFQCDQTELAVERRVADAVVVRSEENRS